MHILFLHPDLGIGGAERLVVDAALALKSRGHSVAFLTSHHDPTHCFPETINGELEVHVCGAWIPRSIFGRCLALCAYVRMLFASLCYIIGLTPTPADVLFIDQISASIPLLRLFSSAQILFYCHFPDQLLTGRQNIIKQLYRVPLDFLEEFSTGLAHRVLVNSEFTASTFRRTFRRLCATPLHVLYPSLHMESFDAAAALLSGEPSVERELQAVLPFVPPRDDVVFLSINRFERKKNVQLAIQAFYILHEKLRSANNNGGKHAEHIRLIIAGGYDERVEENIQVHRELHALSENLGFRTQKLPEPQVMFVRSCSDTAKTALLQRCNVVIYTPVNEHFGIVPIEAMYARRPVIALDSGGPRETVLDGETGYLVTVDEEGKGNPHADPGDMSDVMERFVYDSQLTRKLGERARKHVLETFNFENFTDELETSVRELKHD